MIKLKPVRAAIVYEFEPDMYLEWCEENEEKPTQKGFLEFVQTDLIEDEGFELSKYDLDFTVVKNI